MNLRTWHRAQVLLGRRRNPEPPPELDEESGNGEEERTGMPGMLSVYNHGQPSQPVPGRPTRYRKTTTGMKPDNVELPYHLSGVPFDGGKR